MKTVPRVGVLPLYLALYDQVAPRYRPQVEGFARRVATRLTAAGLAVELARICCVRADVERAVADLASRDIDLLATLHLSYSPSLEAAEVLAACRLPLVLLDTTPAPRFAEEATMDDLFTNHGIHGVQDLACMLRRFGRLYAVVTGHVEDEAFLREVVAVAQGAQMARYLRSLRVLVFGDEFAGMGDFAVEPEVLAKTVGITVNRVSVAELAERTRRVSEDKLAAEALADGERYDCSKVSSQLLSASNRVGLGVRGMLEEFGAGAFSFNFQSFSRETGTATVPFLEASKAMARGVGYAGEGDALTAALVGALLQVVSEVTFTEMFCPDWEGNAIFMSHMGECNPTLAAARPVIVEKDYVFGSAENPVIAVFPVRPGPATLVNLAPGPADSFAVLASRVRILDRWLPQRFPDVPHFWVEPCDTELRDLLRRYSECGGTHHLALLLGDRIEPVRHMAEIMGFSFERI
jgi:L-arabinose isomerase